MKEEMADDVFGDLFDEKEDQEKEKSQAVAVPLTNTAITACNTTAAATVPDSTFPDSNDIIFDIETGPRTWWEIEFLYAPPDSLPPWSDSMVKYGNTKDLVKRKEKYDDTRAAYEAQLADQSRALEGHKAEFLSKAALSPMTGCVVAIGYLQGNAAAICGDEGLDEGMDEEGVLRMFWGTYLHAAANNLRMIGFNIFGFDLPFLVRRSWLLGVDVPRNVLRDQRYWAKTFIDLMQVWGCGVYGERCSLDKVSRFLGGPGKNGDGAEFARLWSDPETREEAVKYLENDLQITAAVARKMGVV